MKKSTICRHFGYTRHITAQVKHLNSMVLSPVLIAAVTGAVGNILSLSLHIRDAPIHPCTKRWTDWTKIEPLKTKHCRAPNDAFTSGGTHVRR